MARPFKPYQTTWGDIVGGLYRGADGRWRIVETGERFREPDERRAVQRFRTWEAKQASHTVPVPADLQTLDAEGVPAAAGQLHQGPFYVKAATKAEEYWPWLRKMLLEDPAYIGRMVGIPELANLARMELPKEAITLDTLIDTYEKKGTATEKAKRRARQIWERMVKITGATTLADLTTEALLKFRDEIERTIDGGGTKVNYFGRIKSIIGFGLKAGLDAVQIRSALDRARTLWTATKTPPVAPHPISPEDFRKLLTAAGSTAWRAWLLIGLNCCMHLDEVTKVKWAEIDLSKGTYAAIRGKTADQRIPRAATLWPETVAAITALERKGPVWVFTSKYGTRYNRNTRGNDFAELRAKAGLPSEVKWDDIRDGAYGAAAAGTPDERWARVLAGHKAAGLLDSYVLRNPEKARPACDAVHAVYGPFPISSSVER